MGKIKYPFGPADNLLVGYAAAIAATIENNETVLTIGQMTGGATLNLTIDSEMVRGANLTVKVSADGTGRVLTFGTGMTGNAYTVTANKSATLTFKYDGSTFVNTGAILNN
jgi:hypothetical protein